jgi:hypothetical protein
MRPAIELELLEQTQEAGKAVTDQADKELRDRKASPEARETKGTPTVIPIQTITMEMVLATEPREPEWGMWLAVNTAAAHPWKPTYKWKALLP